jgi:dTDP-4-amino-4,6-dideoxygalactose transaminase
MKNVYDITNEFESKLASYTGAPYVITVDNASNALFLSLYYENHIRQSIPSQEVIIPKRTYPSVPCEIIHSGLSVKFTENYGCLNMKKGTLTGAYELGNTNVYDSALRFTSNMYLKGTHMCISFTGPYKHFKLSKGGAILTDSHEAYLWFKRARYSGRRECSYHDDNFDMLGWNFYMPVMTATLGFHMIPSLYNTDGTPKHNEDLELPYPDLSKFKIYTK